MSKAPNGWCPQCKKVQGVEHVRTLDFDMRQVPGLPPEEVARLAATALADRDKVRDELEAMKAESEKVAREADDELSALRASALDHKQRRKELQADAQLEQSTTAEFLTALSEVRSKCATLQAGLDKETSKRRHEVPINPAREGDMDLVEVRKKLKAGHRPADWARSLHEALFSAVQQEHEKQYDKNQRQAAVTHAEEEYKELCEQRRQLARRRSAEDLPSQATLEASSQTSTLSTTTSTSGPLARKASTLSMSSTSTTSQKVAVEVATPQGMANLRFADPSDQDDTDMLYGGSSMRRGGSGSLFGRGTPAATGRAKATVDTGAPSVHGSSKTTAGKFGALFKSSAAKSQEPVTQSFAACETRQKAPARLQTLFAQRR